MIDLIIILALLLLLYGIAKLAVEVLKSFIIGFLRLFKR